MSILNERDLLLRSPHLTFISFITPALVVFIFISFSGETALLVIQLLKLGGWGTDTVSARLWLKTA